MNKAFAIYIFLIIAFLLASGVSKAQRIVNVEPDLPGELGALDAAIFGDTTATGERIDPDNTIYLLQRDSRYVLSESLTNPNFPLRIEAEAGGGERPEIISGATSVDEIVPFRPQSNLTLVGIRVSGRNASSGLEDQLIRIQAEDIRVVIDDCEFDESSQSFIRTDSDNAKIYVTNSIVSRIGTPDDPNNGRGIDDRGNLIDTLVLENNTFYNITSRVVRDADGALSYIRHCRFNQNTVMNIGQDCSDFGPVIDFQFTNNLIINPAFLGIDVDADPFNPTVPASDAEVPNAAINLDSVSQEILDMEGVSAQTALISNNNVFSIQELLDQRPVINPDPDDNDVIISRPVFDNVIEAFIEFNGTEESNFEEDSLVFDDLPPLPVDFIQQNWENFDGNVVFEPWDNSGAPFSFSYQAVFFSATASTTGEQLGDLNWPLITISNDALLELIALAEAFIAENTIGNNIGNVTQESVDSLQRAIDASRLVAENFSSTPEEIEQAINALNAAIDFFFEGLITSNAPSFEFDEKISIYPNPVSSILNISSDLQIEKLRLYGVTGEEILVDTGFNASQIDLQSLRPGMYIIDVSTDDGKTYSKRIFKQ